MKRLHRKISALFRFSCGTFSPRGPDCLEERRRPMCAALAGTHLCIASFPSFLPAFRIPPRGPLRDIIRYMHKEGRERTNECADADGRGRTPLGHPTRPRPKPTSSPLHTSFLRCAGLRSLRDPSPELKTFIVEGGMPRRRLHCISREKKSRCSSSVILIIFFNIGNTVRSISQYESSTSLHS